VHLAALLLVSALVAPAADLTSSLEPGAAALESAGPIAFGPDAILFVGDSQGAALWALDTGDRAPGSGAPEIAGIGARIAAMLGVPTDQVQVEDMAVNPISGRVYLSVSRGLGPDATPVILRTLGTDGLEALDLDSIAHARVGFENVPAADATDRRGRPLRRESLTDLHYVDGKVFVAGLSNEEFASKLRAVRFPFAGADVGTSVEIYHGAHGQWETHSPVRTFVPYEIQSQAHLVAAYTCTPLVTFPVAKLEPGAKVVGRTIAELGNRNRPLDMIVYRKDGDEFILMSNSSRGVMKMSTRGIEGFDPITEAVEGTRGLGYETIESLTGIEQLDKLDESHAVVLVRAEGGALDLETIPLP
jgi:hypothetical protein